MHQERQSFHKALIIAQVPEDTSPGAIAEEVEAILPQSNIDYQIVCSIQQGEATEQVQQAIETGVDIVIACGNPQHIAEVAIGTYLSSIPFMICPNENTFSNTHRRTYALASAVNSLTSGIGDIVWMDLGRIEERFFMQQIHIVKSHEQQKANLTFSGKTGMGEDDTLIVNVPYQTDFTANIWVDDEAISISGSSISIINSGHDLLLPASIRDKFCSQDGLLDVVIRGTRTNREGNCVHLSGKKIKVSTDEHTDVQIDGTIEKTKSLDIEVIPKAVARFVPAIGSRTGC